MRKFFYLTVLLTASFLISCADGSNTNLTYKPANGANNSAAAPAVNTAGIEADVKKAVNDTAALLAKNDAAGLDKIYADNYMLVGPDGTVSSKAERLASFRSGETKFDSFSYDEVTVRVHPDGIGAIVIAKANATGMNRGKKVNSPIRVTQVWMKNKDGWQQVSAQATPILAGASGPASNTAAVNRSPATPPAMSNTNAKANSNMNANANANK